MKRILVFAAILSGWLAPVRAEEPGFIRVDEDARSARLQTGITRFTKNGATVDLIGAVHIGDKAYYEALNERFKGYEVLLFEMVGGENIKPGPQPEPEPDAAPEKPHPLRVIYGKVAKLLDLTGQVDHIDYHAANFVHADLTSEEFTEKQAERGESLLTFLLKVGKNADSGPQPKPITMLYAIATGSGDLLKLSLIHTMGAGADQVAALAGENVIIGDRNVKCLEVMSEKLEEGHKNLGIFYGAAHFPDMEKRLLEMGFTRTTHEWLTAWDVRKPKPKARVTD